MMSTDVQESKLGLDSDNVPVEQDTIDEEDIPNVMDYIMPAAEVLQNSSLFSISYSRVVFQGWVKQPTACCGASSVAGAWNALHNYHRRDYRAKNHEDILNIYRDLMMERITKKTASFERKLGTTLTPSFWSEFEAKLLTFNRVIGSRKSQAVSKKTMEAAIALFLSERQLAFQKENIDAKATAAVSYPPTAWECFDDLFLAEGIDVSSAIIEVPESKKPTEENASSDREESEAEDEEEDNAPTTNNSSSKGIKWQWRKDFMDLIRFKAGMKKLNADKPTTAPIGNWGILEAVSILSEQGGLGTYIQARLFMGKKRSIKTKVDVSLSRKDTANTIQSQWDALRYLSTFFLFLMIASIYPSF